MYTHSTQLCTHTSAHMYMHTHRHTHTGTRACMHTLTYLCTYTHAHVCTCVHAVHTLTHAHAHTHLGVALQTTARPDTGGKALATGRARSRGRRGDMQGPVPRPPRRAPRPRLLRGKNVAGRQTPLTAAREPAPFLPAQGHGHGHRQAETASLSPSRTQVLLRHRDELTPAEGGGPTRRSHWGRQHEPESLAAVCETSFDGRIRDSDGLTREPLTE